jgi:hypothetical protein
MTVDERGRAAAVAVRERVEHELDVGTRFRELTAIVAASPRPPRRRLVVLVAAVLVVVALLAASLVAVRELTDTAPAVRVPVPAKDLGDGGFVIDHPPTGLAATASWKYDQAAPQQPAGFRNPLSRLVLFQAPARGGARRRIAVVIWRLPGIPPFTDGTPDGVQPHQDPTNDLPTITWRRSPGWEISVSGDVGVDQLAAVARGVNVPTDPDAVPAQVTVTPPGHPFALLLDEASRDDVTSAQHLRALTYSDHYGSVPSLTIATAGTTGAVHHAFASLERLRIHGRRAILTAGRNRLGQRTYALDWDEAHRNVSVQSTGLTREQVLAAGRRSRLVAAHAWSRATRHTRVSPLENLDLLRLTRPPITAPTVIATYPDNGWTYQLGVTTVTQNGTPWICANFTRGGNGSIECADPKFGFTTPTFLGGANFPLVAVGSVNSSVASVEFRLADGRTVTADFFDTGQGRNPRIFYANLGHDTPDLTFVVRDRSGRVEQRGSYSAPGTPSPPDVPPPAS